MKRRLLAVLSCCFSTTLFAQWPADSTLRDELRTALHILAGDSMRGRGNFSEGLHKAAAYIAETYKDLHLATYPGLDAYYQPFVKAGDKMPVKDSTTGYDPKKVLLNVVGVLPGRSRKGQAIVFSAHYDHLGSVKKNIYNGANDNASGTVALLALARYFARRADNERTLIFCAFAGEELGMLGSSAFVPLVNEDSIVAVFNLEMLGQTSVGRNTFFITGAPYSDLRAIMERNLANVAKVRDDPYPERELFRRSDNFPFAMKGIPAHTIMASDDTSPCYHSPCDDVKRLDVPNLARLIRYIALGAERVINGSDTPSRIKEQEFD